MNKRGNVLLIIFLLVIIAGVVYYFLSDKEGSNNNELKNCYQETATEVTSCGGLGNGAYSFEGAWANEGNAKDGNKATYGEGEGDYYMYVNYSKPKGALSDSKWFVVDEGNKAGKMLSFSVDYYGKSAGCWDADSNFLILREYGQKKSYGQINHECFDGKKWIILNAYGATFQGYRIYEEAMIWNPDSNFQPSTASQQAVSNIVKKYPSATMSLPERCSTAKAVGINIAQICGALCSTESYGYDSYDCENDRIVCNCIK